MFRRYAKAVSSLAETFDTHDSHYKLLEFDYLKGLVSLIIFTVQVL